MCQRRDGRGFGLGGLWGSLLSLQVLCRRERKRPKQCCSVLESKDLTSSSLYRGRSKQCQALLEPVGLSSPLQRLIGRGGLPEAQLGCSLSRYLLSLCGFYSKRQTQLLPTLVHFYDLGQGAWALWASVSTLEKPVHLSIMLGGYGPRGKGLIKSLLQMG